MTVAFALAVLAITLSVIIGLVVGIVALTKENKRNLRLLDSKNKELKELKEEVKSKTDEIRDLSVYAEQLDLKNTSLQKKIMINNNCETSLKKEIRRLEDENRHLIEHGANVLHLQVKENEYNDILDGKKKDIAVANKKYWQKRLLDSQGEFKTFHAVSVTNGHRKSEPGALFLLADIHIGNHRDSGLPIFDIILDDRLN